MSELRLPPGFINVHWLFSLTGDPEVMSFATAFSINDAILLPDAFATSLADDFADALGYGLGGIYSQWSFVGVNVQIGNDGPDIVGHDVRSSPGTGGSNATLPQNCCAIVKKTTGFAGQRFRGRFYMPPISLAEADVNNVGMIDSGVRTSIQTRIDRWIALVISDNVVIDDEVLLHSSVTDPTVVTANSLESLIATQRRRLR
jgi:hypothetical protein